MSEQPASAEAESVEQFASAQGLRVAEGNRGRRALRAFLTFMRTKRLGAAGLLLVVLWSVIAIGTVGDGGGWLGLGRYDSRAVFEIASVPYADDKLANALDGLNDDLSDAQLREIVSDPQVFGAPAVDNGVAGEMVDYALGLIDDGILLHTLVDAEQIEIENGRITDFDAPLATGTDNPLSQPHCHSDTLHPPLPHQWSPRPLPQWPQYLCRSTKPLAQVYFCPTLTMH